MSLNKLTLIREFGLGVGMTLFLCLAPQASVFWTGALFVGMFTIYETFPDFHWCPAWTAFKILDKEEDIAQGIARIFTQVLASILAGIVGYQLLDTDTPAAVYYPTYTHEDDWRSLVWVALVWAAWLGLVHHQGGKDKEGFRRTFALTATFVSANYMLQGVGGGQILNTAVNTGRLFGAKIFFDDSDLVEVKFDKLWIILLGPALGVLGAWVCLKCDAAIAAWDANIGWQDIIGPAEGAEDTTALYGSTGAADAQQPAAAAQEIALSPADDAGDQA